jgi:putative transposase
VTPAERHGGNDREKLAKREAVYAAARTRHPERWTRQLRNWKPAEEVWLNPEKKLSFAVEIVEMAA